MNHSTLLSLGLSTLVFCTTVHSTDESLESIEVTASRAEKRREIRTFVQKVTRFEGGLVGRWDALICPMVVGVSDAQAQFIRHRLVEVQNTVRKDRPRAKAKCPPNFFVIVTDEPDQVLADWKERDPGMFRWKTREGVSRSAGEGPVRTWHNSILDPAYVPSATRSAADVWEHITTAVILVDARATGKVTLAQLADYISLVGMSQVDLSANPGGVDSILQLFSEPPPEIPPAGLTEWDYAFLNGLYRASYSPADQQRDIEARMVRQLVPR
jgi:hypothetical protein